MTRSRIEIRLAVLEALSINEGKLLTHIMLESNTNFLVTKPLLNVFCEKDLVVKTELTYKSTIPGKRKLSKYPPKPEKFNYFLTEKGLQVLKKWKIFIKDWKNIWSGTYYE